MRRILFIVAMAFVATLAPQAYAQSAVMQHYRAYEAALRQNDIPTAVREAQAALAASEARDGDGGRTAVLSLNLASVQLAALDYGAARQAAERALALARAGAVGVDLPLAELTVARANLAFQTEADAGLQAAGALHAVLTGPNAGALTDTDTYLGGAQLGVWGFAHENWSMARLGWSIAGTRPAGSPFGETYGLGRARLNEALAIITGQLGGRVHRRIDEDEARAAHALLGEAAIALYPLSRVDAPTGELTVAQRAYSEARVWFQALNAKLHADGIEIPPMPQEAQGDGDGLSEMGPVDITRPRCMFRLESNPRPEYADLRQVAAVALFLRIGSKGEVVSHQIAARAGSEEFAEEVTRVAGNWRAVRLDGPPNCRMEANVIQIVNFILRD